MNLKVYNIKCTKRDVVLDTTFFVLDVAHNLSHRFDTKVDALQFIAKRCEFGNSKSSFVLKRTHTIKF